MAASAAVYPVLRAMEEAGRIRRGYFVDGLGAAQFALAGALDRLRAVRERRPSPRRAARSTSSPRPTRPTRTAPRCRGRAAARMTGGRSSAPPAPTSSWSTASRRSTSSAAARRSRPCPRPTTRPWRSPRSVPCARSSSTAASASSSSARSTARTSPASPFRPLLLDAGFVPGYRGLALRAARRTGACCPKATRSSGPPQVCGRTSSGGPSARPGQPGRAPSRRSSGSSGTRSRGRGARQEPPHPVRRRPRDPDPPADERLVAPLSARRALAPAAGSGASRPRGPGRGRGLLRCAGRRAARAARRGAPSVARTARAGPARPGFRRRRGASPAARSRSSADLRSASALLDQRALAGIGNVYKNEMPLDRARLAVRHGRGPRRRDADPPRRDGPPAAARQRPGSRGPERVTTAATAARRARSTSTAGPAGPAAAAGRRSQHAAGRRTCRGRRTGARPVSRSRSHPPACPSGPRIIAPDVRALHRPGRASRSGSTSCGRSPSVSSGSASPVSAGAPRGSRATVRLSSYRDVRAFRDDPGREAVGRRDDVRARPPPPAVAALHADLPRHAAVRRSRRAASRSATTATCATTAPARDVPRAGPHPRPRRHRGRGALARGRLAPDEPAAHLLGALHDRFGGQANLAVLAADGSPHHYAGNDENPVFSFRLGRIGIVSTGLYSLDRSLFRFAAPGATERRLVRLRTTVSLDRDGSATSPA